MYKASHIYIQPIISGRTPKHFGVNVEIQEYADSTNLWDWLADSGVSVVREFHPEKNFRNTPVSEDAWGDIPSREAFDEFRKRVMKDPQNGGIMWNNYSFNKHVKWLGIADDIIRKVKELEIKSICSLGYVPAMYPRPIVNDPDFYGIPGDDLIDWTAAASAYDYYFAMIYHYAMNYGIEYFSMVNEPESMWDAFYFPVDLNVDDGDKKQRKEAFSRFIKSNPELMHRYYESITTQYHVMARIARMAMEDVRVLLSDRVNASGLFLLGPTSGHWEAFWEKNSMYMDACDYHHYDSSPYGLEVAFRNASYRALLSGKRVSITEFNRFGGPSKLSENFFSYESSMQAAGMLMGLLQMQKPEDAVFELAAFYLLSFPSTHRNYKHLLYGDMNMVDWSGNDTKLWDRGEEWYPNFEEQQIRFTTPAYHMFRMLARSVKNKCNAQWGHPVLRVGWTSYWSVDKKYLFSQLRFLIVDQGDQVMINILNTSNGNFNNFSVDISGLTKQFRFAVIRETSRKKWDQVIGQQKADNGEISFDLGAECLTQIILTNVPLDKIKYLELKEVTNTPGGVEKLELYQTTRLRAIGYTGEAEYDLTDLNVVWSSSQPEIIKAYQGGLIQRVRQSSKEIVISAGTLTGLEAEKMKIQP